MALMLQPVFVDLSTVATSESFLTEEQRRQHQQPILKSPQKNSGGFGANFKKFPSSSSPPKTENTGSFNGDSAGGIEKSQLLEDSLYSMWKVATKVKSVMAEGARFENLTWRAWYKKSQFEKIERDQRESETALLVDGAIANNFVVCSQATAIPKPVVSNRLTLNRYGTGYSTILAEIQQASQRQQQQQQLHHQSNLMESPLSDVNSFTKDLETVENPPSASTVRSTSSVVTNSIKGGNTRKKKKNVDKFIKKQQLEDISEQNEETRIFSNDPPTTAAQQTISIALYNANEKSVVVVDSTTNEAIIAIDTPQINNSIVAINNADINTAKTAEQSSVSTNDTMSCGSIGDQVFQKMNNSNSGMKFKKPIQPTASLASPSSDQSNVSLLTMLLNRGGTTTANNNDAPVATNPSVNGKRPGSCPPPILSLSPPNRPGAPLPPGFDRELKTALLPKNGTNLLTFNPVSTTPAPTTNGPTSPPQLGMTQRRRTIPNPSDFTTTMYIW